MVGQNLSPLLFVELRPFKPVQAPLTASDIAVHFHHQPAPAPSAPLSL